MTTEVDSDSLSELVDWALETGLWDGTPITWKEASTFYSEVEQKITQLALLDEFPVALAWLGTIQDARPFLAREIVELVRTSQGIILAKHSGKSWLGQLWKDHKVAILMGAGVLAAVTVPAPKPSSESVYFSSASPPNLSPSPSCCRIGGINGMKTSPGETQRHTEYIKSFAPDKQIDWVYNRTHGPLVDLAEVFSLNYLGVSPNTAKELHQNWIAFHEVNKDNPHAKYLQFCHSQGAIHVRNALLNLPREICDRIIVVAIAPAAVVTRDLCFQSFNYVSKKDIVSYGELLHAGFLDSSECGMSKCVEMVLEARKELIILEPHPDATGIDHDFESLTFSPKIKDHIADYFLNNGEYDKKASVLFDDSAGKLPAGL